MGLKDFFTRLNAFRITLIYFIFAAIWIVFSDLLLDAFLQDQDFFLRYQTIKGLLFIALTSGLIFTLVKAGQNRLNNAHRIINSSRERYQLLVDESPFMIGLIQDGEVIYANPEACKSLEYSNTEIIGMSIDDIVHKDFIDETKDRLQRLSNGEKGIYPLQEKYVTSSGREIPVEVYVSEFQLNSKNAHQVIAIDITDRVTREEKLEEALEAKEVLLAEIHHRVKNNLAVISALIQLQAIKKKHNHVTEELASCVKRISTIAFIHEQIYQSEDLVNIRLDKLISVLISSIVDQLDYNIEKKIEVSPITINVNQTVPCALFFNEAVALIYSSIQTENKISLITFKLDSQNEACNVQITVEFEKDNRISIEDNKEEFSFELLETIAQQLKGELSITNTHVFSIGLKFTPKVDLRGSIASVNV